MTDPDWAYLLQRDHAKSVDVTRINCNFNTVLVQNSRKLLIVFLIEYFFFHCASSCFPFTTCLLPLDTNIFKLSNKVAIKIQDAIKLEQKCVLLPCIVTVIQILLSSQGYQDSLPPLPSSLKLLNAMKANNWFHLFLSYRVERALKHRWKQSVSTNV